MNFGERKRKILSIIIKKHIESGTPIGSKTVCQALDISVSSATVRNEMAELSDLGYLDQPHTSAGRTPSYLGYRMYVNRLMRSTGISSEEKNFIDGVLCSAAENPEQLLNEAARLLSRITNFTAVLTVPPSYEARVRDVKFIITGKHTAMLVLMTTTGTVQNKLFRCSYNITEELVEAFEKLVNEKFKGKLLRDINPESMNMVVSKKSDLFVLMSPVLNALMEASREALEIQIKTSGEANLLRTSELTPSDVIQAFKFLRDKDEVLKILFCRERGINVLIGEEDLGSGLENVSMITARYSVDGRSGAMGIVGPLRMDYESLVSKIDYLSGAVGGWLERILEIET